LRYEADGSAGAGTGAGGTGAASPAAAAAPPSLPPQPQPESQALQQSLHLLQQPHLLLKIASSKPRRHFFLQGSQHESQAGSQAFAAQPQPLSWPQLLQAFAHGSQQSLQQLFLRQSKPRRPPNRSQQPSSQQELQGSQQVGSQHFGSQHAGLQAGLQHFGAQHFGWHESQQPQPSPPSMRSKSSKLNAWLHRPALTIIAPIIMCNFIEPRLLMRKEPSAFAHCDAPRL
jgi:hypothetical protein